MENQDRYKKLLRAIEAERSSEEQYFQKISSAQTIQERIASGALWYPVQITKKYYTVGELIEIEVTKHHQIDVNHSFKSGASARIFSEAEETTSFKGVISFARKDKLRIIIQNDEVLKEDILERGKVGVELVYDERPYKVMRGTIKEVIKSKEPHIVTLRKAMQDPASLEMSHHTNPHHFEDRSLNESQREAVIGCLQAPEIGIIHGPPGTGKTTTISRLIKHLVKTEKQILVCAPSNHAVDHLVRILESLNIETLRIGNVTRIGDSITHLTLREKIRSHPEWKRIKKIKIESTKAREEAQKHKRSFGHKERAHRSEMFREAKELKKWAKDLEDRLVEQVLSDSQVICTTLVGSAHRSLRGLLFNTVIIDEASQALEPECWTAILKAKRVILAGDHKQLPPTVKSQQAMDLGLAETMLDILADNIPHTFILTEQYRMHDQIMAFSNQHFYNGKLHSNEKVKSRLLRNDIQPLLLIDTSGCGFEEVFVDAHRSRSNPGEYGIIREHMLQQLEKYVGYEIGIISPYAEQVRLVRRELIEEEEFAGWDIEVDTIDGFQGQEKDIIFISLVRSNDLGQLGFLKDQRRLNVALTRAKMKLIIVGDFSTLSNEKIFNQLAEHVEQHGRYQSAWEYLS